MHAYLASASTPFDRLVRAYFWHVQDADFRHAQYWRDQVTEAEAELSRSLESARNPQSVELIQRNAMLTAYQAADKVKRRPVTGGFRD